MTMELTERSQAAHPAAEAVVPGLWIWRASARAGDWLPGAMLQHAGHAVALQEPFGEHGTHEALRREWRGELPREADEKRLRAALRGTAALAHTLDGMPDTLHASMVDAAADGRVRHLLLHVKDATRRWADWLASPARRPGVDALIRRDREQAARLARLMLRLQAAGQPALLLALDDLAGQGPQADAAWAALRAHCSPSAAATPHAQGPAWETQWRERLQGDFAAALQALDAHWAEAVRREANWVAGPELAPGCLAASVQAAPAMVLARLDPLPTALLEGEAVRLSGVVLPPGEAGESRRLLVRQGGRRQRLGWDQPSPAVAAKFPQEPAAARARFKPVAIRVARRQPASIVYRPSESAPAQPVADIRFEPMGREPVHGIYVAPWSIGYQPIPKVACTSVKELLFSLAVGLPFSSANSGGARHVHDYFFARSRDVGSARFRFVILRDPIKRFLSAFSNRVLHHKELSRPYLEKMGLPAPLELDSFPFDPTLEQFVDRFDLYRKVPTIEHHFGPFSEFVAPLSAFDKVYPFEQIDDLVQDLQRVTGLPVALPHSQRGGPKLGVKNLSASVFDKLVNLYAEDYRLLQGLYEPAALR